MIPRLKKNKCIFKKDLKLVKYCMNCGEQLPSCSKHHFLCSECWNKRNESEGNFANISGVLCAFPCFGNKIKFEPEKEYFLNKTFIYYLYYNTYYNTYWVI